MEREIDEILRRFEQYAAKRRRSGRWRRQVMTWFSQALDWLSVRLSHISLGQLMIASFLIICVAYFFRWMNPVLMRWVIIGGLVLFLTAFVFSLRRGRTPIRYERRWRGQRMDYDQPSFTDRVRAWFDRNRRGRGW